MIDIFNYLSSNSYPGRGIAIGKSADGNEAYLIYFIMGRSVNSRNRVFVENADGSVRTKAFDESKLTDPSLIIYAPVRVFGEHTIVTNGDQTDTIYNSLRDGKTFADALRTRGYEPDAPNYTPRISGLATIHNGKLSYKLSILKKSCASAACDRFFFETRTPRRASGISSIHTNRTATRFPPSKASRRLSPATRISNRSRTASGTR